MTLVCMCVRVLQRMWLRVEDGVMVEPGVADEASGKDSDVLLKRYTTPSRIDDNSLALLEVALARHH